MKGSNYFAITCKVSRTFSVITECLTHLTHLSEVSIYIIDWRYISLVGIYVIIIIIIIYRYYLL